MQQRRVHLKFSGHYRGINELEKVGLSGRLRILTLRQTRYGSVPLDRKCE